MLFRPTIFAFVFAALSVSAHAVETSVDSKANAPADDPKVSLVHRATHSVQGALDDAMDLIGIRYKRGGNTPETGFDCSGFVGHVFREGMGLMLPRSSKEISKTGETVKRDELKPGDLVFFNTLRRTFSHVGIYLGNNQFIHSPRAGGKVRIESLNEGYWRKRFDGGRRVTSDD